MKVAVTGASGFIGSALLRSLRADGHDVIRLVRRPARSSREVAWDPPAGNVDSGALLGVDAVVNLAGEPIRPRLWTQAYGRRVRESRINGTGTISRAIAGLEPMPRVLVSASGIGYYGAPAEPVDESAPAGSGFFAEVVAAWERAADPAREAGIRVVHPRSGIVLGAKGTTLSTMLPFFRLGVGGRLGSGRQHWSFVSIVDEVRALRVLIDRDDIDGPVNLTTPHPVTNAEFTRALAGALHRPAVLPVPEFALRMALGKLATEILGSARVMPARLTNAGFTFEHPRIEDALAAALRS